MRRYALAGTARRCASFSDSVKSVLSIRPWKIGTPSSMHFMITSRRCMPASRASSVGVRWIAIYVSSFAECRDRSFTLEAGRRNLSAAICGLSDRIWHFYPPVFHSKSVCQQLTEPTHAEGLCGVVACRDEVDPAFSRVGHDRF